MNLFLSYSRRDSVVADRVYDFFATLECDVQVDRRILTPGDDFEKVLIEGVQSADSCILLVSKAALESEFIKKEVQEALVQVGKRKDYHIIPLITELGVRPPDIPRLKHLEWGDISRPQDDEVVLSKAAKKIQSISGASVTDISERKRIARETRSDSADRERILREVQSVFDEQISSLAETVARNSKSVEDSIKRNSQAILSQQHIITPRMVEHKESQVQYEILVITRHLYNDTENEDISRAVADNLKRGIHYKYILVPSEIVQKRLAMYRECHLSDQDKKNEKNTSFFVATDDLVMPSSEIVIYDPIDPENAWGYFQLTYGRKKDLNTIDLFFEVPDRDLDNILRSVYFGIKRERYTKIDITDKKINIMDLENNVPAKPSVT